MTDTRLSLESVTTRWSRDPDELYRVLRQAIEETLSERYLDTEIVRDFTDAEDTYNAIKTLFIGRGDRGEDDLYGVRSTFTTELVNENAPRIINWVMDNNSLRVRIHLDGDHARAEEELERRARRVVTREHAEALVVRAMYYGLGAMVWGPGTDPYVADTDDVSWDYLNRNLVAVRRTIPAAHLMGMGLPVSEGDVREGRSVECHQACVLRDGRWATYVLYNGRVATFNEDMRTIGVLTFSTGPNGRPRGVFDLVQREEVEKVQLDQAIDLRVRRRNPATMVDRSVMGDDQAQMMFNRDDIMLVDGQSLVERGIDSAVYHPPSLVGEIEVFQRRIDALKVRCTHVTGLMPVTPTSPRTETQRTATEALMDFSASTQRTREFVEKATVVIGDAIGHAAMTEARRTAMSVGVESPLVTVDVLPTPVDQDIRYNTAVTMLPFVVDMLKMDPEGAIFGGRINAELAGNLVGLILRDGKIDSLDVPVGWDTATTNETLARQRQEAQEDANLVLARAEMMKGEAEMKRADNEVVRMGIESDKNKHDAFIEEQRLELDEVRYDRAQNNEALRFLIEMEKANADVDEGLVGRVESG